MIYKAVFFDAGGVLHPALNSQMKEDIRLELGLSPEQINEFWGLVHETLGIGLLSEEEFWLLAKEKFGIRQVSSAENLLGRKYQELLSPRREVFELAKKLSSNKVKIAVLSNTIEPHAEAQLGAGQFEGFDELILSHTAHLNKPDPRMYAHALKKLGVKPEESIFIDDVEENLTSADKLGMRTILYTDSRRLIEEVEALALPVPDKLVGAGAFTLLVDKDGSYILQHRDDKKGIMLPGGITGFGGSVENRETPLECALRELNEETNLTPSPKDLRFLGRYQKTKSLHGEDRVTWAFELRPIITRGLEVFEGQGYIILKGLKDAEGLDLSILLRQVLRDYENLKR